MKNLLIGMVLLGSATVLSHAHAADPADGSGQRFIRLSSGNAAGGVYSINQNQPVRFISLDKTPRHATEAKPIALHGGSQKQAAAPLRPVRLEAANPPVEHETTTTVVSEEETRVVTKTQVEQKPVVAEAAKQPEVSLAQQQHLPVNARREAVVANAAAQPQASMSRIPVVTKEPVLPLVRTQKAAPLVAAKPSPNLDAAFSAVEKDIARVKPEVVVSDMSATPTQTEVVIRDAEKLVASSEEVLVHSQAVPVEKVAIADVAPITASKLKAKPIQGVEQPKAVVVADASMHSVDPWEVTREVTGTEREFMVDRSLKRVSKHVQAIAEEDVNDEPALHETIEAAQDEEEIANVSLDDEYIPESVSGSAALTATPVAKPDAPQLHDEQAGGKIAFQWPVRQNDHTISSPFGSRKHPITGKRHFHTGIDIPAPRGTAVLAAADGEVMEVGFHPRLGKYIKVDHGQGVYSIYGHLERYMVRKGGKVDAGQRIGSVGTTGRSTGPHLHFTINRNGKLQNPMVVLRDSNTSNSLALAKPE